MMKGWLHTGDNYPPAYLMSITTGVTELINNQRETQIQMSLASKHSLLCEVKTDIRII